MSPETGEEIMKRRELRDEVKGHIRFHVDCRGDEEGCMCM